MLKISVKTDEAGNQVLPLLEVEGRLAGPWVEELERCWESEQKRAASGAMIVRLSNVTFIDETGTDLLRKIFRAGARLEGSGCLVRAIIARITGAAFSARDCESESRKTVAVQSRVETQGGKK